MRCTGGSAQKGSNELEPIIRIEQLTHTYSAGTPFQRSAVDGVELDIMPGEFLGVIGHTGSGKSTLIQHLNGLLKPTQGHIYLNGKDIWADPKQIRQVRFQVGLVFQYPEYQLFEETVYKDIAFGPGNMGLDKEEIDRRVRESARMVGLAEELLENAGVVTMPGSAFGDMGEGYLRLVFANSDENLKEAVRRIADYVARAYPGIK